MENHLDNVNRSDWSTVLFKSTCEEEYCDNGRKHSGAMFICAQQAIDGFVAVSVPGQPRGVRVEVLSSTAIRATWNRPLYKGRGIFAYEVFYNKTSSAMDSNEEARGTLTKEIQGLEPHKYYGIAVAAVSDRGVGAMSFKVTVRTFEDGKNIICACHVFSFEATA